MSNVRNQRVMRDQPHLRFASRPRSHVEDGRIVNVYFRANLFERLGILSQSPLAPGAQLLQRHHARRFIRQQDPPNIQWTDPARGRCVLQRRFRLERFDEDHPRVRRMQRACLICIRQAGVQCGGDRARRHHA
jgi:hypothetical protein